MLPFWFRHCRGVKRGEVSENPQSTGAMNELPNSLSASLTHYVVFFFFLSFFSATNARKMLSFGEVIPAVPAVQKGIIAVEGG